MKVLYSISALAADAGMYVYGAGQAGRAMAKFLRDSGREPLGFITTSESGEIDGLPVRLLDDWLQRRKPADIVVIASSYVKEIAATLDACRVEAVYDGSALALAIAEQERLADDHAPNGRVILQKE